ncbi:MAG: OprO/OprP family phosphate-selective porin [Tannerellaceae bacterium]|jgi:hypothetical protein|nr:OprO/OprP family phosphate-selective porin [Tannerellaceae bacterium]
MKVNKVFYVAALAAATATVVAQEKSIEERVSKVEGITSKLPSISGLVNTRFQYDDVEGKDATNSFDVRRARLDIKGGISSKVDYRIQLELSGTPKILDAFVTWKPSSYINLRVGQFKYPFTLENPYSPTGLETIENSTVISKFSGYSDESGIGGNGREIGLAFFGGFGKKTGYNLVDYYVGIVNGNGLINQGNKDNNTHKDLTGILTINPIKPLAIAISHYNGKYGKTIDDQVKDLARVRTGFGAKYDDKKLLVRGEYLFGTTGTDFKDNKEVKKEGNGYYLTAAYYVAPKWQPVLKYDYYQADDTKDATKQTNYIVGVSYYPIKNVRLQFNYTHRTQEKADRDLVATQLLISF